ncbi:hypothetical protein [Agriterribacter sp.]|uniref:hypothetical protein n=1 Tax=Agriterribacter sp. TaxID=2821509 RepID=UPI002CAC5F27|nr:hypothetical protein [Agriterribacter sp.]HTN07616.1 hypothetical protein [Agriterribacter sp.]
MKVKNFSLLCFCVLFCFHSFAQVGIGTATPAASAALDVTATTKGFLPPRVSLSSTAVAAPVVSPVDGLIVYNTATTGNVTPGLYVWNSTSLIWDRINTTRSAGAEKKLGIDLTGSAFPQKVYHDLLWYQTGTGGITPAQVPWYCENVTKANQLAAYWLQKIINEFKSLENDNHYDQSQNAIIVNSNILGKIVLGRTALGTGGVDMDNDPALANLYGTDYFTLIVGSNGTSELYTMEFNIGIVNTTSGFGFRIVYQTSSGAGDGHLVQYSSVAAMTATAPQCKTRSSLSASAVTANNPALMAYPISIELNF